MSVTWNGNLAKEQIDQAAAQGLLAAAAFFQTQHRLRLNVSNPRPYLNSSRPGEYPRARTGFGRDAVRFEPTTPEGIIAAGQVRFGYLSNAFYMAMLEVFRGRKGLVATLEAVREQLASVALSAGKRMTK